MFAGRSGWSRWRGLERADAVTFGPIPHSHSEHFRLLVAKTTAPTFVATKWRVCPFCFLGWHHRNGSQAARVASLRNVNPEALHRISVRGMYGIRAANGWRTRKPAAGLPETRASMKKKGGTSCSRRNTQDECALGEKPLGTVRWPGGLAQQGDPALASRDLATR